MDGGGQILKTTNGGNNWSQQFYDSDQYFRSVEFPDANIGFAGTLSDALFRTDDGGTTWTNINANLPQIPAGICGMSSPNDSTIFITGVFYGLAYFMRSYDAGITWQHYDMSNYVLALVDVHFKNNMEGFLVGQGPQGTGLKARILHTTNGGQSWNVSAEGTSNNERAWKIEFLNDTVGFVSIEDLSPYPHYWKTTDGGQTWQDHQVATMVTSGTVQGIGFLNEDLGWVGGWNDLFFETTDGGQTWTYQPNVGQSFNRFWRLSDNTMLVGGLNIYRYEDPSVGHPEFTPEQPRGHLISVMGANPASGSSVIQLDLAERTYAEVSVYDLAGKRLETLDARMRDAGTYTLRWDHSNLLNGTYLVALYTYHGFNSVKVQID